MIAVQAIDAARAGSRPVVGRETRLTRALPAVVGVVVLLIVVAVLRIELRTISWIELAADVVRVPRRRLAEAIGLTILSYAVLTGYDLLAFVYLGKRLPRWRVMITAFLAYAVSNTVSLAMLSGASIRYRFYSRWGITAAELSQLIFSYSVTFWLGLFALGGVSLMVMPLPPVGGLPARHAATLAGLLLSVTPLAYLAATIVRRSPLRIWRFSLPVPAPRVAAGQIALSVVDWALAGAVLYVSCRRAGRRFQYSSGRFSPRFWWAWPVTSPAASVCSKG